MVSTFSPNSPPSLVEDRCGFICGGGGRFIKVVVEAEGKFEAATAAPGELSSSLID